MSRPRTAFGLAGFALASGVALGHPHADPAPSFTGLPAAKIPAIPAAHAAPEQVRVDEHTDSLILGRQPSRFGMRGARGGFSANGRDGWCISEGDGLDALPGRMTASVSRARGVMAMRLERLSVQPGTDATLEVRDVWIDAATLGVRVASTARLPLARLAGGPGGFGVYAFRDGRTAHVIVPSAASMAFRDASGQTGVSACGHVRLALEAEPRSGSMALLMGAVSFPSNARSTTKHASFVSPTNPASNPASPLQAMASKAPPPPPTETRFVRVSASLSQTSQEREPVFSVALGWEDPQQSAPASAVREGPPPPIALPQPPSLMPASPPAVAPMHREIDFEGE